MARKLDIAFWDYDRTRLLADGTVRIDGVDATFHGARIVPEIFEAMIRRLAYDVSELGMTYFLRTFDEAGRSPFLALPVFLVRSFRHGAIYINRASGIAKPQDLAGKRIGELALYGHDAGVMPKGILSDEFGVRPSRAVGSSAASTSPWTLSTSCRIRCPTASTWNGRGRRSTSATCWTVATSTR